MFFHKLNEPIIRVKLTEAYEDKSTKWKREMTPYINLIANCEIAQFVYFTVLSLQEIQLE